MNKMNKHIPTVVFAIGFAMVAYSIYDFFRPRQLARPVSAPKVNTAPAQAGTNLKSPDDKKWLQEYKQFNVNKKILEPARPVRNIMPAPTSDVAKKEAEKIRVEPAERFLGKTGLNMKIPDRYIFIEDKDGAVEMLRGIDPETQNKMFLFTAKGKYDQNRALQELYGYFEEQGLQSRGEGSSYNNRSGLQDMTQFEGSSARGEKFQAFYFTNPKTNSTHMFFMMGSQMDANQARGLADTIKPNR